MLDCRELAKRLLKAEENHKAVSCITEKNPEFDIAMGYQVQNELVQLKKDQGHKILAYKMGITSQAKMKQMNINEPIYGYIFDYMNVPDEGELVIEDFIHPKVEAEIAFILGEDVEGPNMTMEEVLSKTEWVLPALEIIDSRYTDFVFKLPDVVADNTSAARVVFGKRRFRPNEYELDAIGVTMFTNGELRADGVSAAVLGNPANSVAVLANMLSHDGKGKIAKGSIILSGGITEAIMVNKGDSVTANYDGMGSVSFQVR
ncbi:2-keto-4-pentenoate hydratase [Brevibacillus choshinensis]|uniref:2-keto-4-pentenoate hydratase n=1 Tax=Brevibacillus choshinensis TaxID=54911 RepID=UPI002E1DA058|nr:fumarylacetoacetate hydrolase family protein [Brevibacillus choshinensis]MED4784415.1 fumarylacetoacetate hydrolase family protein [Brevibacillus choshinensis]